jgi:hypothetical protein
MATFADFFDATKVSAARDELARMCKFPMFAEDLWEGDVHVQGCADPRGDPRFTNPAFGGEQWIFLDWLRTTVAANLLGEIEHVLIGSSATTYFGALFQSATEPDNYLVTVRGTESRSEWAQNLVAAPDIIHSLKLLMVQKLVAKAGKPKQHPLGGVVPAGFHGIY